MDEHELLSLITAARAEFGVKCKKFAGALTVELLKEALKRNGIETSARDVYIEKVPLEIDLLIPKVGAKARHGILYRPEEVLAAFEVKGLGSFGLATIEHTCKAFGLIRETNPLIRCAYVTLFERRGYKYTVTKENINHPAFTFFWHQGSSDPIRNYEASGDFARLLEWLRAVARQSP